MAQTGSLSKRVSLPTPSPLRHSVILIYDPSQFATMNKAHAILSSMSSRDPAAPPVLVPLCALFGQELRRIYPAKPSAIFAHSALAKRGEDLLLTLPSCPRSNADSFSAFGIFDGHNGVSAAVYTKEHLLEHVLSAIPPGIGREEWLKELPRAMVAGFVKTDIEFQSRGEASGTTATLVVIDGLTVTVASVGDSRCIFDSRDGVVTTLTVDHRLEENAEERERVRASGGEVYKVTLHGGKEIGPLRCWPGGLCLSRSIGDADVGEFIVPVPHVKQVKISSAGGRLIIASDGIWDALSSELAAKSCRGLPADLAAKMVVKEALRTSGLKDDTTCMVVDIIASDPPAVQPTPKQNQSKLRWLLFGRPYLLKSNSGHKSTNKPSSIGAVEEIFEEGSAMLDKRLATNLSLKAKITPFQCAICQIVQAPNASLPGSDGSSVLPVSTTREAPFLCADCSRKKEAMEGKCSGNR